jgi:hypothetical protein
VNCGGLLAKIGRMTLPELLIVMILILLMPRSGALGLTIPASLPVTSSVRVPLFLKTAIDSVYFL